MSKIHRWNLDGTRKVNRLKLDTSRKQVNLITIITVDRHDKQDGPMRVRHNQQYGHHWCRLYDSGGVGIAGNVLKLSRELQQTAKVFEELIQMYRERKYLHGFRMINDIKMLFERLFISYAKGSVRFATIPTKNRLCLYGGGANKRWKLISARKSSHSIMTVTWPAYSNSHLAYKIDCVCTGEESTNEN